MRAGDDYDLAIIGAGSGGLTAASFGVQLGAKMALIERHRVGGDCTWTGCVPSKSLLKVAKVAHAVRTAAAYGVATGPMQVDMAAVRAYVRRAIGDIYRHETPEELQRRGIEIHLGEARFVDPHTIEVRRPDEGGVKRVRSRSFLIATGARPRIPELPGLAEVPYRTYEDIFDNDRLPAQLAVIGAGPVGIELAQAYHRLGAQVTVIGERVLPKEDPEAAEVIQRVLSREGIRFVAARPLLVARDGEAICVDAPGERMRCELLLVAAGRAPALDGLDLERAGVRSSAAGIPVDPYLRTNIKHIYAAGDAVGGQQFTHLAGWQAFQAARNALLPGKARGLGALVPRVTYTDPEVAHVGLTEPEARERYGAEVAVTRIPLDRVDRAICENDRDGFLKLVEGRGGRVLGATLVAGRAGEAITELALGMDKGLTIRALAGTLRAYPTYSTGVQQALVQSVTEDLMSGKAGKLLRWLVRRG